MMKWRRAAKKAVTYLLVAGVSACAVLLAVNGYIIWKVKDRIISPREAVELENVDCIMVLGCGVRQDGSPSGMLKDRLEEGIGLYKGGASDRLLMSGDHGRKDYDEVNLMKQYAVEAGIPSENIFMDHAGFSTYESMYRARDIFQVKKIVIVTQNYHMYRALFVARSMGMEAYGVASDLLARPKDLIYTVVKPKPTYLGEAIPVNGNGNVTNDKEQEEGK